MTKRNHLNTTKPTNSNSTNVPYEVISTQEDASELLGDIESTIHSLRQRCKDGTITNAELETLEEQLLGLIFEITDGQGIIKSTLTRLLIGLQRRM